jgi:hypothetical protein
MMLGLPQGLHYPGRRGRPVDHENSNRYITGPMKTLVAAGYDR